MLSLSIPSHWFASETFDAVVACKVYCYIPSSTTRVAYLAEIERVLRAEAPLLLTSYIVPTEADAERALAEDPLHRRASVRFNSLEPLDTFVEGRGYVHWFTYEGLLAELEQARLSLEHVAHDGPTLQVMVAMRRRGRPASVASGASSPS